MHWADERYVRLYTRNTVEWNMWPWESRALFPLLSRAVDRAGLLELGRHGIKGIAVTVGLPLEVTEAGLAGLLEDGCVVLRGTILIIINHIQAQECTSSDAQRKRDQRERERDRAHSLVTIRDTESQDVTKSHSESQPVTSSHSVPNHAVPNHALKDKDLAVPAPPALALVLISSSEAVEVVTAAPAAPAFDFEALYKLYPRHEGKRKGLDRCRAQIKTRAKYDAFAVAVANYGRKITTAGTEPQYVKQFDTFLGCWEDFVTVEVAAMPARRVGYMPAPAGHNTEERDLTSEL